MSQQKIQQQEQNSTCSTNKKSEWKKNLKIAIAMILVAAISIGGTLAYLSKKTEDKENVFTGSKGIELKLTEPEWTTNDNDTTDIDGETLAGGYTPNMEIPKDPTVTNTSTATDASEWVAIRVDYEFASTTCSKDRLDKILTFQYFDGSDYKDGMNPAWIKIDTDSDANGTATNYDIYLYNTTLAPNNGTATLFNRVVMKDQATLGPKDDGNNPTDGAWDVTNSKYCDFKITVCAAAIKNDTSIGTITNNTILEDYLKTLNVNDMAKETSEALSTSSDKHYAQEIEIALVNLLK